MKLLRFTFSGFGLFLIVLFGFGCGAVHPPKQVQLKNGIPLILKTMPDSHVATVLMSVRAGSVHENDANQGISRLLERCLFRSSTRYPNVRETIESFGGNYSSNVFQDFMAFSVTAEASHLPDMIRIFSDVLQFPRFDSTLVSTMRRDLVKVVEDEYSNPRVMVITQFLRRAFQRHPYRFIPLGNPKTLRTLRTGDVVRYFESLFVPANVEFVVTGHFNRNEVLKEFNESLGSFVRDSALPPVPPPEPEQTAPREAIANHPFSKDVAFVGVGWKAPSIRNPDTYSVDVLVSCLGIGESSRLNAQIRNTTDSVYSIWAEYFTPREPGYLLITAVCNAGIATRVKQRILDEIGVLKKDEITPTELERAKMYLMSMKAYSDEGSATMAGFIGYWSIQQNVDFSNTYSDRIAAVTAKEVQQAARVYLRGDNFTSVILLPATQAAGISK